MNHARPIMALRPLAPSSQAEARSAGMWLPLPMPQPAQLESAKTTLLPQLTPSVPTFRLSASLIFGDACHQPLLAQLSLAHTPNAYNSRAMELSAPTMPQQPQPNLAKPGSVLITLSLLPTQNAIAF